jgi:hypothetical protein
MAPLMKLDVPGRYARPAQPQLLADGNAYTVYWYSERFTPAAVAALRA